MNYEDIKRLIDDMGSSKIDELNIEFPEGMKISMKKTEKNINSSITNDKETMVVKQVNVNTINNETVKEENCKLVTAPMVGTFYASASPKESPFVKVGDKVKKGDVLCIIEAMKLMNEIESEFDGEIAEICVNNEEVVDFGKVLFKIKS